MNQTHVVFGANGALGYAIVNQLVKEGKPTRAVVRNLAKAREILPAGAEIVTADALKLAEVSKASEGAAILYNIANVPYADWFSQMPLIADNIMAAAEQSGAKLLFAGNFYGYGHFQHPPVKEDHPLAAHTRKGQLRNQLEAKMLAAHQAGRVQVVIPRMPEFYGPNVTNALIAPLFKAALAGKKASWPANLDQPHEMLYNADAAAACLLLANNAAAYGQSWQIPGAGPITGRQFLALVYQAAGKPLNVGVMAQWFVRFGGLFNGNAREFAEMMYQFAEPYMIDGSKFAAAHPDFHFTPHLEAVRHTLEWFGQHPAA